MCVINGNSIYRIVQPTVDEILDGKVRNGALAVQLFPIALLLYV